MANKQLMDSDKLKQDIRWLILSQLISRIAIIEVPHYNELKTKGWFTLDAAVWIFRSLLHQQTDREFSISLQKCYCLLQTHALNAVM